MSKGEKIENRHNEKQPTIESDKSSNGKATLDEKPGDLKANKDAEKKQATKKRSDRSKAKKEIERLKNDNEQLREQLLRKAAEFDNFRKRKEKEVLESWELAKSELFRKLLPALDDLDRTLESAKNDKDFDALVQGLELVSKSFLKILDEEKVEVIEAVGQEFNPEIHEALLQMEKDGVKSNTVIDESQKGYKKGERILRPSKVVVSK